MTWHDNAAREPAIGPLAVCGREVMRAHGYSLLELERAGLGAADVERLGIEVDPVRITAIGCNVMQLRHLSERS